MAHKLSISVTEACRRALRIAGLKPTRYKLGAGGRNPEAENPFTTREGVLGCDCVGFVLWAWGLDRFQPTFPKYGGWINTDSAIDDAKTTQTFFEQISGPEAGALVVFPGIAKNGRRVRIGHVALVVDVPDAVKLAARTEAERLGISLLTFWSTPSKLRTQLMKLVAVVDCAAAKTRRILGHAVKQTTAAASWDKPDTVWLRYKHAAKA